MIRIPWRTLQLACYTHKKCAAQRNAIPDKVGLKGLPMFLAVRLSRLIPAAPRRCVTVALSTLFALSVPLSVAVRAQQPQPETPQQPATPASAPDATQAQAQTTPAPTTPTPAPDATQAPAQTPASDAAQGPTPTQAQRRRSFRRRTHSPNPAITEEELKQMLVGKVSISVRLPGRLAQLRRARPRRQPLSAGLLHAQHHPGRPHPPHQAQSRARWHPLWPPHQRAAGLRRLLHRLR